MSSVAFLLQPLEIDHFYTILGPLEKIARKIINRKLAKLIIRFFPSFKLTTVRDITSSMGEKVDVHIVICPLLPEHIVSLDEKIVLGKINKAIDIASKSGATIVELSSFISLVKNDWENTSKKFRVALTTGENFLAGSILGQLSNASESMGVRLEKSSLAVISSSNAIGSLCTKILSQVVNRVILFGKMNEVMSECKTWLKKNSSVAIDHFETVEDVSKEANVILITTNSLTTDLKPVSLKPGSILCDIGIPPLIAQEVSVKRKDILAFDGRLVELPHCNTIKSKLWKSLFPKRGLLIFGRLAESIILGFESRYENFSLGSNTLTPERAREIFNLGKLHGFEITPFRNKNVTIKIDDIRKTLITV